MFSGQESQNALHKFSKPDSEPERAFAHPPQIVVRRFALSVGARVGRVPPRIQRRHSLHRKAMYLLLC